MSPVATPAPPPILTTSVIVMLHASFPSLRRMQAGKGQSQRLVPTVHTIERLHRIAGSTFHQIIQGSDDHKSPLFGIEFKANVTVVAPRQNLWLRIAVDTIALFDQANERLTLVGLSIKPPQSALVYRFFYKGMCRNQYSAH